MSTSLLDYPRSPTFRLTVDLGRGTRTVGGRVKRLMDLGVSLVAVLLLISILLIIGLLIKVFTGGPVVFAHTRIGGAGDTFRCYKFRTMTDGAELRLQKYLNDNPEVLREWRTMRKLKNHLRATRLGNILRKSSLDELPQLINVIRGDMSFGVHVQSLLRRFRNTAHI